MVLIHCHVLLSVVATPHNTYQCVELMASLMPLLVALDAQQPAISTHRLVFR